jgi:hypothetical protein
MDVLKLSQKSKMSPKHFVGCRDVVTITFAKAEVAYS